MRKLSIVIDTNDINLCENCIGLGYVDLYGRGEMIDPFCAIFGQDLQQNDRGKAYRCSDCDQADQGCAV